jgi:DinB family protein
MHASELFLMQQDFVTAGLHGVVLPGLTNDEMRQHPPDQNSVAWLVWHTARWQDVITSSWIADQPQVLDRQSFTTRIDAPSRVIGTGMTFDEAAALSKRIDVEAAVSYWDAVVASTKSIVRDLTDDDLHRVVADERRVTTEADGTYRNPRAPWLDSFLAHKTIGWYLMFLPIHMSEHLVGEALSVRGQIGRSAGA